MKRATVRIDSVRISGLDAPAARALPGGLEAAVRRAIGRMPQGHIRRGVDVPRIHVGLEGTAAAAPDRVAAAVVDAIDSAARRGGPR